MTPKIILGIPSAADFLPDRAASLARLRERLGDWGEDAFVTAGPKAPHWEWAVKLWTEGRDRCANDPTSQFVTIQDDVLVPSNFRTILSAMYSQVPDKIVALHTGHPVARELARGGARWMRTRAWVLGNGYSIPGAMMPEFVDYVERNVTSLRLMCEDNFVAKFAVDTGRDVWHCLPSLVEHDVSIPSTWGAGNAMHRRPTVSYLDYTEKEMARPDFWQVSGAVRYITDNLGPVCWCCLSEPAYMTYEPSGVQLGAKCAAVAWQKGAEWVGANPVHPGAK